MFTFGCCFFLFTFFNLPIRFTFCWCEPIKFLDWDWTFPRLCLFWVHHYWAGKSTEWVGTKGSIYWLCILNGPLLIFSERVTWVTVYEYKSVLCRKKLYSQTLSKLHKIFYTCGCGCSKSDMAKFQANSITNVILGLTIRSRGHP